MNVKALQSEDFHSYIDNYKRNKDRIELLEREIENWEHEFGGIKPIQTNREPSAPTYSPDGLSPVQREALYRIEQCYLDIDQCNLKIKVVDELLDYLEEVSEMEMHQIISMRKLRKRWESISMKVDYSYSNCRYLYWRGIERYMSFVRQIET